MQHLDRGDAQFVEAPCNTNHNDFQGKEEPISLPLVHGRNQVDYLKCCPAVQHLWYNDAPSLISLPFQNDSPSYACAALCILGVACLSVATRPTGDRRATDAQPPIVTPFAIRSEPPQPRSCCLCATNEDVVKGDVDQLDDISDETHDQDWNEDVSISFPYVARSSRVGVDPLFSWDHCPRSFQGSRVR